MHADKLMGRLTTPAGLALLLCSCGGTALCPSTSNDPMCQGELKIDIRADSMRISKAQDATLFLDAPYVKAGVDLSATVSQMLPGSTASSVTISPITTTVDHVIQVPLTLGQLAKFRGGEVSVHIATLESAGSHLEGTAPELPRIFVPPKLTAALSSSKAMMRATGALQLVAMGNGSRAICPVNENNITFYGWWPLPAKYDVTTSGGWTITEDAGFASRMIAHRSDQKARIAVTPDSVVYFQPEMTGMGNTVWNFVRYPLLQDGPMKKDSVSLPDSMFLLSCDSGSRLPSTSGTTCMLTSSTAAISYLVGNGDIMGTQLPVPVPSALTRLSVLNLALDGNQLLAAGMLPDGTPQFMLQNAAGWQSFGLPAALLADSAAMTVADLDQDGWPDLIWITTTPQPTLNWAAYQGKSTFDNTQSLALPSPPATISAVAVGPLDASGIPHVVVSGTGMPAGQPTADLVVYQNQAQ